MPKTRYQAEVERLTRAVRNAPNNEAKIRWLRKLLNTTEFSYRSVRLAKAVARRVMLADPDPLIRNRAFNVLQFALARVRDEGFVLVERPHQRPKPQTVPEAQPMQQQPDPTPPPNAAFKAPDDAVPGLWYWLDADKNVIGTFQMEVSSGS
jgi:hypothetical protein